jgi:histone acetyltransferase (RNA polymerase elongator complex component)
MTAETMDRTIREHLSTIKENSFIEIGFYGGSFTGIEIDKQRELLEVAYSYIENGLVHEVRLSTRPDYISGDILMLLSQYGVRTIELGVQSLDSEVLVLSNRGHTPDDVYLASSMIKEHGFRLGIQTMVGLPGDNREKDIDTAQKVVGIRPEIVRIYPALVIKGTYLESMLKDGAFVPLSVDEAADICAELLSIYEKNNIKVIRLGLQTTESINEGAEIAAGPFHPAFRQLVESRLALRRVEAEIARCGLVDEKNIVIFTDNRNISNVVGQKRQNVDCLKRKYGFHTVQVLDCSKAEGVENGSIAVYKKA